MQLPRSGGSLVGGSSPLGLGGQFGVWDLACCHLQPVWPILRVCEVSRAPSGTSPNRGAKAEHFQRKLGDT